MNESPRERGDRVENRAVLRAVVVALLLASRVATADDPIDLPFADAPVEVLPDHIAIRPLKGSVFHDFDHRVVFESGSTHLVMEATPTALADDSDLAAQVARGLAREPARVAGARVEPFATALGTTALRVVPRAPARANELIFAAYVVGPQGTVDQLAFYVEEDAGARDLSWRSVAERIARTAQSPLTDLTTEELGPWTIALPAGAKRDGGDGSIQFFSTNAINCMVINDAHPPPEPAGPLDTEGRLLGQAVTWHLYRHTGDVQATALAGTTYVSCSATTARNLAYARRLASTLAVKP